MKNPILACLCLFALSIFACASDAREALWEAVDKAIDNQLPKTALEHLDKILPEALADKAYAEATMAMMMKIRMEASIDASQMGVTESAIKRLNAEIQKAHAEMLPVLHTIHALWLWEYYEENEWKFVNRTHTDAPPGDDFATWDLATILSEIDSSFSSALEHADTLKATPISDWMEVIEPGTVPTRYRPTLYDFLAHEALSFYQAGERAPYSHPNPFTIQPEDPIFAPANEFMAWKPETTDPQSPTLKAIQLFQDLLSFHASDTDASAFFDADLARIEFGENASTQNIDDPDYRIALQHLIEASIHHEFSSFARATLAKHISSLKPDEAHAIATAGFKAFPDSEGGRLCYNLIQQLEAPKLEISQQQTWNSSTEPIQVEFRNLSQIHFRLVELSSEEFPSLSPNRLWEEALGKFLVQTPILQWSADLPPHHDYAQHEADIPIPQTLTPGFYLLLASIDDGFALKDNFISSSLVTVTDIGAILMPENNDGEECGLVLSAITGEPIPDAKVQIWLRENATPARFPFVKPDSVVTTDKNGRFSFTRTIKNDRRVRILASHGDNQVWLDAHSYPFAQGQSPSDRCTFFTDRAIYRPGQTIHYKGVLYHEDDANASYHTLSDRKVTVVFYDANNQEFARTEQITNDFGSFRGTFTAPRDRLTGGMRIAALDQSGSTGFSVEEYKRPKFEVKIDQPAQSPRLNEHITLTGKASAYTEAPIDGAKVVWRVERNARMPYWCWWSRPESDGIVARGETSTGSDGSFSITFLATPDPSISEKDEPVFSFSVYADVTDSSGETRSGGQSIRVGYTSMQAGLTVDEWQTIDKPVEVAIATSTLSGLPQPARGTIKVFSLKAPSDSLQSKAAEQSQYHRYGRSDLQGSATSKDLRHWTTDALLKQESFETGESGKITASFELKTGAYRIELESQDSHGKTVRAFRDCFVIDPDSSKFRIPLPFVVAHSNNAVEPGDTFTATWGSGHPSARAFVEIACNGRYLERYWTYHGNTQQTIQVPVIDAMRGGFSLRITQMRNNTLHSESFQVDVPWTNKQLSVNWEQFRSKLRPEETVTWTAQINGPNELPATAEMVATLYDASLDTFSYHFWFLPFGWFRNEQQLSSPAHGMRWVHSQSFGNLPIDRKSSNWIYPAFSDGISSICSNDLFFSVGRGAAYSSGDDEDVYTLNAFEVATPEGEGFLATSTLAGTRIGTGLSDVGSAISIVTDEIISDTDANSSKEPDASLDAVQARKNLQETAFFYPHLMSDEDGTIRIEFTMPEALTRWSFLGLAHDKDLRSGLLTGTATTSKDLMVQPNPPRFVREGDRIAFPIKVTNRSAEAISGKVRLTFADAATLNPVDSALGNLQPELPFEIPAGESRTYSWDITVPDGMGFLTYKAVGASANLSDGEEAYLPVLNRGILLTESLPLPIRGKGTREFSFDKLLASADSDTLRHQSLKVQMVSQPAWYAVMALPYLMEFPHECSEQLFSRLYANALASHIANSDPKIRRVFDLWRESSSLESPLFQNEDIKGVMIEETPWMRDALGESEARRQLGLLFESNRLQEETDRGLRQLSERQLENGLWPWFPGGVGSHYISRYIVCGFGRLSRMGVDMDTGPALKALPALDLGLEKQYKYITHTLNSKDYVPGHLDALDLYTRSFFLESKPIDDKHRKAFDYFLNQARKHWNKSGSLQTQVHLAIALHRFGDQETAHAIMQSVKERAVHHEEFGMYWKAHSERWWWYHAPIETQALIIEAFAEITKDFEAVEDCKVWLLKQKQTQQWESTKATADAVYAILNHGSNLLASDALVEVSLGGETIQPEHVEAGTGFYEQTWIRNEIRPDMGQITLRKTDDGVAWGSAHWQYIEDIEKVTPHEDNPLKLRKSLWIKQTGESGPVLKPVSGPLAPGDELVVRIELRADRDFEFVHMKDQRGSGTEPVNVLSRYKWQDRLSYYESTRDTATHFFIDNLPKGTYVFEYSTRIQHRGTYQSGIASIQCMYAPEFNSHSQSFTIQVE